MAVNYVVEKETAVGVLSYGQCFLYRDVCVYIKITSSQHYVFINQLQIPESGGLK